MVVFMTEEGGFFLATNAWTKEESMLQVIEQKVGLLISQSVFLRSCAILKAFASGQVDLEPHDFVHRARSTLVLCPSLLVAVDFTLRRAYYCKHER